MVQVLPYVPSFGEKLASSFGQAAGNIGASYLQGRNKDKARSIIQQFQDQLAQEDNPESNTPIDNANIAADESVIKLKPLDIAEVYKAYETVHGPEAAALKAKEFQERQVSSRKRQEELHDKQLKKQEEELKKAEEMKGAVDTVERLEELIPQTGKTFGSVTGFNKVFDRQQVEEREEFDTSGLLLADYVYTHFNKGTVTDTKLKLIKDQLAPNSKFSERVNKARINSIKRILSLPSDLSTAQFNKELAKEQNSIKKESSGKPPLSSFE